MTWWAWVLTGAAGELALGILIGTLLKQRAIELLASMIMRKALQAQQQSLQAIDDDYKIQATDAQT